MAKELLIEIGCEEIPVEEQISFQEQIPEKFNFLLKEAKINHSKPIVYATPRRIVIYLEDAQDKQQDMVKEIMGPPVKLAFDEKGSPTEAAIRFANACSTTLDKLIKKETKKGIYLFYRQKIEGEKTIVLLPDIIKELLHSLECKKPMYWEDSKFMFVRPIRWILALYNNEIVPLTIAGISSSNITKGHRFLGESYIEVSNWESYTKELEKNFVILNNHSRKLLILNQMKEILMQLNAKVREDEELLQYAVHTTEYPLAILCEYPVKFLFLPEEIIITCLKVHQKAFSLEDQEGKLLPYFIVIANVAKDESENIKTGNERIAIARLEDASFFWEEDKKTGLSKLKGLLSKLRFQEDGSSYLDKINRMKRMMKYLSQVLKLGSDEELIAMESIGLCKCDLSSKTVGEFPTLQGKLGALLAKEEKMNNEIVRAIYEHYLPNRVDDPIPSTKIGALISLLDKFDNLCVGFANSLEYSGSKDPYGLRRNAIGLCKILMEYPFFISIEGFAKVFQENLKMPIKNNNWIKELKEFLINRFRFLAEQKRIKYDIINSVLAVENDDLHDAYLRLNALNEFCNEEVFKKNLLSLKRVNNILKNQKPFHIIDTSLFFQEEEKELYQLWLVLKEEWKIYLIMKNYKNALKSLTPIARGIDKFFDNVLVMAEDIKVRNNRLAILNNINEIILQFFDISGLSL